MRIAVLGAGAWGTALAQVLSMKGHQTCLWTWQVDHASRMSAARTNEFLPDIDLPTELTITSDLPEALAGVELIVLAVPSVAMRATFRATLPFVSPNTGVVCASKGIEQDTLHLMSEVVEDEQQKASRQPYLPFAVLSGPSFAREVARKVPTNLVAASKDAAFGLKVQHIFSMPWLRVYTSDDPVGVEIGGALKNVIAVAAGACDGLGLGHNTRAALITRGIAEMARLVTAKHGSILTLAGLAGIGDLVLTCTGELSRNRTLGFKIGAGESVAQALASSDGVSEGYVSAKSAHELALALGVELPICEAVFSVLYGGKSAAEALSDLLGRPLRAEWETDPSGSGH